MSTITKAVELLGGPGPAALRLECSTQAISFWVNGKRTPSVSVCIAIERETAGEVTVEQLRPDIDWSVIRAPRAAA
jgi:DNA-binding transcriptional regulator YdaS (Cro superfamily)